MDERELNARSVRDLREIAQEYRIEGRSRLRKAELVDAILAARALMGIEARMPETPSGAGIPETEAEAFAVVPRATGEVEVEPVEVEGTEVHPVEATLSHVSPGVEIAMGEGSEPTPGPEPGPAQQEAGGDGAPERPDEGAATLQDAAPPATAGVYLDRGPAVPERYPGKRLRAMVRDPSTVYVYWEIPELDVEGWEVNALGPADAVIDSFRTDGRGRSGYLRVPSGTPGRVLLSPLAGGQPQGLVATATFGSPASAPSQDTTERWVHVSEGGPSDMRLVEAALPTDARSAWDQLAPPLGSSGQLGGERELPTALRGVSLDNLPSSSTFGK